MPSKFTPRAVRVIAIAKQLASNLQQTHVGSDHLLLGLLDIDQSIAVKLLQRMGVDTTQIRSCLWNKMQEDSKTYTVPVSSTQCVAETPCIRKIFQSAQSLAQQFHHIYIGTEHLLLGLLEVGQGLGIDLLHSFNVDLNTYRRQILLELNSENDGEDEDEGGALFGIGVVTSDDGAVMQTSQTAAIAQADAGGILLHGAFGGLVIAFEDGFQHIVGDTDASVAHFGGHQVAFDMHSDGYTAVLWRELQGIG